MRYYDIHTHRIPEDKPDDTIYILNLFPDDFHQSAKYGDNVFYSCGVHPWHSDESYGALTALEEIVAHDRVVAVGEAGLDKFKGADAPVQEEVFRKQAALSECAGKPMVIHSVRSWDRLIDIYKDVKPQQPWILHGYRGKPELAKRLVDLGFYFSVGEYFNPESLKLIPKEKLFCETDESKMGIDEVYKRVADALEVELGILSGIIVENVLRVFPAIKR